MAKMPFRGIAQIVSAGPPKASPTTVVAPAPQQQAQVELQSNIRPIGSSAVQAQATSPRAGLARWWSAIKQFSLTLRR